MSRFTEDLWLSHPDKDSFIWRLRSVFSYEVGREGSGLRINVPIDFPTDGATVPRIFWVFYPPSGVLLRPSIVHDYLYDLLAAGVPHELAPTREEADRILHEACLAVGISRVSAWLIWAFVRCFGARHARPQRIKEKANES